MSKKVLLVGWDAADWKIIQPLVDAGLMPTTKRLIEGGVMSDLLTLAPILSPVLWTTIATGKRPHKHGILGFTEPTPTGTGVQPITNISRKTKALWNILNQNGKRSNVVGWWPSSPVEPINGVMVSNHYQSAAGAHDDIWPLRPNTIHPLELTDTLANLRIHPEDLTVEEILPFLPEGHRIDQEKDGRMQSVLKVVAETASIQACAMHLMEHEPWDLMAVYFDGIDHFCHGFMRYHPPRLDWVSEEDYEIYKNVVSAGYVFHDMMLGNMCELAGDDATVIVVSDHGFHPDHMRREELPNEPAGPATEHREHGIFLIHGPGIRQDQLIHGVSLLDVTPTILSLFDLAVGEDMDGRVLSEIYTEPNTIKTVPSWDAIPGEDGQHPRDMKLDVDESEEAIQQLVDLGYIDRPSGDGREAAENAAMENQYNLARSYMHGGMHGEAAPILVALYERQPLEFRFGIQLAICLQALEYVEELAELVTDLRARWQRAATASSERLAEVADIARERRALHARLEEQREKEMAAADVPVTETMKTRPLERLFTDAEQFVIKKLRSIARGNVRVLDYMEGWVAMARKDYTTALDLFKSAEATQSGTTGFHFQLAEAYRELRRYDDSLTSYQRVLELDPHDAGATLGLARVYISTRQYTKALEQARAALALKYHLPLAHSIAGVCLAQAGKFEDAVKAFQTAIEINPNYAEAYEQQADIWEDKLQDADRAVQLRRQAESVREQRHTTLTEGLLAKLPRYDQIDYPEALPVFPVSAIVPRLADPLVNAAPESADGSIIYVVSGQPRSGTSMMVQMLLAGGLTALTDEQREADQSNPRGYFELDKVKRLPQANDWLEEARGKVIKVVTPLLPHLPQDEAYRVILMERDPDEIIASQLTMLERDGKAGGKLDDKALKAFLSGQEEFAHSRLAEHQIATLTVAYKEAINTPEVVAERVAAFVGIDNRGQIKAMCAAVDAKLYRQQRKSLPG